MTMSYEKIDVFRKECRKYFSYRSSAEKITGLLEILKTRYEGLHSAPLEKIGSNPNRGTYSSPLQYIEQKASLESKRDAYLALDRWIVETVSLVPYKAYRSMIWRSYVLGDRLRVIADEYDIDSKVLRRNMRRCILSVLDEDRFRKLEEIRSSLKG